MEQYPDCNWGVACGPDSALLVIDIDPRKNGFDSFEEYETMRRDGALPPTLSVITGGAGRHLYFQYPAGETVPNRTNWMPGVDVKAAGGYVVMPGSNHISGGSYMWENWGHAIASTPEDVIDVLARVVVDGNGFPLPSTDDILKGVAEGQRDEVLFRAACRWRRQLGDSSKSAVMLLALNAAANCDPPFPQGEVKKCVESAWRQDYSDGDVGLQNPTGPMGSTTPTWATRSGLLDTSAVG
jgi:hypothetical protein